MSFHDDYVIRKTIRVELQRQRCVDRDHSIERYMKDAEFLNRTLAEMGITSQRKATW